MQSQNLKKKNIANILAAQASSALWIQAKSLHHTGPFPSTDDTVKVGD